MGTIWEWYVECEEELTEQENSDFWAAVQDALNPAEDCNFESYAWGKLHSSYTFALDDSLGSLKEEILKQVGRKVAFTFRRTWIEEAPYDEDSVEEGDYE